MAPCPTCGPLPNGHVHSICHKGQHRRSGCGHPLADHTEGLKCRTCGRECGIYCERPAPREKPAPKPVAGQLDLLAGP